MFHLHNLEPHHIHLLSIPLNRYQCSIMRKFLSQWNLTKNLAYDQNGGEKESQNNQDCQTNPLKFWTKCYKPNFFENQSERLAITNPAKAWKKKKQNHKRNTYRDFILATSHCENELHSGCASKMNTKIFSSRTQNLSLVTHLTPA